MAGSLLLGVLAITLVPGARAEKKEKNKKSGQQVQQGPQLIQVDTSKLVWPLPPDPPRIRYLSEMKGEPRTAQPTTPTKKKQSWMDRLAGLQQVDYQKPVLVRALMKPYGVVVDSRGRIYAADTYVGAVFIFNSETHQVDFIRNGFEARFKTIIGLAIDDNDRLFVVDADLKQINVFDANHKFENAFGSDVLERPTGAALDTENRLLYVVDTGKNHVAVFDADSFKLLHTIGTGPKRDVDEDPGVLLKPTMVAVDHDGNVYVADTLNNRIQIFDADGHFVSMFGRQGDAPGTFQRPKGIAIDADGHIWVADSSLDRIQIFDKEGHLLAYFGEAGTLPGQFGLPTGLFIDKQNRVIVAEQLKGRLQLFRYIPDAEAGASKAAGAKEGGRDQPTSADPGK
jgi:DNA-binding beta-propeller fold protein YncE